MAELESNIQRRCQKVLKDGDAFVFKTHGDMYSRKGISDLIACIPATEESIKQMLNEGWFKDGKIGIFCALEIKTPEKIKVIDDERKAQEIVGKEIRNAGGIFFVIDDDDYAELILKKIKGEI